MKKSFSLLFSIFFILGSYLSNAQNLNSNDPLPQDPQVITGELKNGLKYYIRQNLKPEKRVEFRLVINAGSILEDENQRGLAHFVEHMAFNGSKNFTKNELVSFLEKSGVSFGADLNAYTSFDETVYMFQMPSDKIGLMDSSFMVLEDWAHNLLFEDEEIDKERGVIHEEWRLGLGAQDRMQKKFMPILLKDSHYAVRLPIGKMSVVDSCKYDVLRKFYHDWYRPNLMAVIVVGDIDPVYAERKIKEHFKKMKGPKKERERIEYDLPDNEKPLVAIASDKEATSNLVAILYKRDKQAIITGTDYRRSIMTNLYTMMLNARFFEISEKPEAPFLFANSYYGEFLAKSKDAWQTMAVAKENKNEQTLSMLIKENERVKKFGFTEGEFERQKAELMSMFEKSLEEKDKTESNRYVQEYIAHFLHKETFPGIEYEFNLVKSFLPEVKLEEINALGNDFISDNNLIVLLTGPDKEGNVIPIEKDILKTIAFAKKSRLKPYVDKIVEGNLIEGNLAGGKIVNSTTNDEFGFTEIQLDNGVKVVLKSTDFKNDEIIMTSFNEGGTSVAPDSIFFSTSLASAIISQSGVGPFNSVDLAKYLTGKVVKVGPQISSLTQGITGSSNKKDFEIMLQLTYSYFTQPRKDQEAFDAFKSKLLTQFKFLMSNPQVVFYDTLYKLATSNDPRTIVIPTEKEINSINLDQAYDFYKERFADAEGFRFFFVGSFDIDSIKPLITKYLGSLPATNRVDQWKNVNPEFPEGITKATVYKGTEPKSSVAIMLDDEFEWNRTNRIELSILMKILEIRLRESMREDQGGVYGVRSSHDVSKYPESDFTITINWGCSPENVDTLVNSVFNEMKILQSAGPEDINMKKAKETMLRDLESNVLKNSYWRAALKNAYYYNERMYGIEELKELITKISKEDIHEAANQYFDLNNYLKVILMPEETEAE